MSSAPVALIAGDRVPFSKGQAILLVDLRVKNYANFSEIAELYTSRTSVSS
jgi:hypothetical protein